MRNRRNKWKVLVMCFVLFAAVLLEPVSYARADETAEEDNVVNGVDVPQLLNPNIEFTIKEFFDWFGLVDVPEENVFKEFVLTHGIDKKIDYSLYDMVCDFELKTMGDDGNIITSTYSYTIDFMYSDSWSSDRISIDDNLVYNYTTDSFGHEFIYKNIIKNATGFKERNVTGKKNYYTYNTVISKADFYFVRKSDGEKGLARRFVYTWDSDFYLQKCIGISYYWYDHESGAEKEVSVIENVNGVYATEEDEKSVLALIAEFIADLPLVLVTLVVGFVEVVLNIAGLFQLAFPFLPPAVFYVFACIIFLTILIGVYKTVVS